MYRFLIILSLLFSVQIKSQCVSDEYNKLLLQQNQTEFPYVDDISTNRSGITNITIPVVFHIVYNTPSENIPDGVIYQQLEVLNESFNLRNADTVILTDTLKKLVGNFKLNFELAWKDPDGNITNGITRTETSYSEFTYYQQYHKKKYNGKEPWDTERYLNIWVCDLSLGLLGYAQFPGGPVETDGITMDYELVGDRKYDWCSNRYDGAHGGRILVHEVGHWLSIFHPWGYTTMCGDDMVNDTPLQRGPVQIYQNCPDTLFSECYGDSNRILVKNYMDYSGNNCMVAFTPGQVAKGLNSLNVMRQTMLESYEPRPVVESILDFKILQQNSNIHIVLPPHDDYLQLEMYNLNGKRLINFPINRQTIINLGGSGLVDGVYLIRILGGSNLNSVKKFYKHN
jgi:hypothetical protein